MLRLVERNSPRLHIVLLLRIAKEIGRDVRATLTTPQVREKEESARRPTESKQPPCTGVTGALLVCAYRTTIRLTTSLKAVSAMRLMMRSGRRTAPGSGTRSANCPGCSPGVLGRAVRFGMTYAK